MTDDDRHDLLAIAATIYAARVTGSAAKADPGLARRCVAEARDLIAEVYRQGEVPEVNDDLPDDALSYLKLLVESGPVEAGRTEVGRRVLLKRGLATWVGDGMFAATDRGRALLGVPAGGVSLAGLEETE